MDTKTLVVAFGVLAVAFVAIAAIRIGFEKLGAWAKAHPFRAAIGFAAVAAVAVSAWAGQNRDLIECWTAHKIQCFFPIDR